MKTTVIGSYPKPEYVKIPDWFTGEHYTNLVTEFIKNIDQNKLEKNFNKAIEEVIKEQVELKIDVITDGEIRRENYIYAFCRSIKNIDFNIFEGMKVKGCASHTISAAKVVYANGELKVERGAGKYIERPAYASFYQGLDVQAEINKPKSVNR